MHTVRTTTLSFPELDLPARAAHHLRGYFGTLFRGRSPLLHNHYADGTLRHAYPKVQYKVLNGVPTLIGVEEGADPLAELFLEVSELELEGRTYPLLDKRMRVEEVPAGVGDELLTYELATLYMPLNQDNHRRYVELADEGERALFVDRIAVGHLLAAFKGMGVWLAPEERVFAKAQLRERETGFKNIRMVAFAGTVTTNAVVPEGIGIGKSVGRGFGALRPERAGGRRERTARRRTGSTRPDY